MELIEQIRERCIAANIDIVHGEVSECTMCHATNTYRRPIRLADVLLAMPLGVHLKTLGEMTRMVAYDEDGELEGLEWWDLTQDDLTKQSPETLAFIGKVLGITS